MIMTFKNNFESIKIKIKHTNVFKIKVKKLRNKYKNLTFYILFPFNYIPSFLKKKKKKLYFVNDSMSYEEVMAS